MAKKAKAKKTPKKAPKKSGEKAKVAKPDAAPPSPQKEEKAVQPKPQAKKKANGGNGKLAELRKGVDAALKEKKKAQTQADELRSKAKELEQGAKQTYTKALAPYRTACKQAGVECEFAGGHSAPVAPRVRFLLEKVDSGIRVAVKGRPETEKVIPNAELKKSVMRAAYNFCEEAIGPESEQGKKWAYVAGCSYVGSFSSIRCRKRRSEGTQAPSLFRFAYTICFHALLLYLGCKLLLHNILCHREHLFPIAAI